MLTVLQVTDSAAELFMNDMNMLMEHPQVDVLKWFWWIFNAYFHSYFQKAMGEGGDLTEF